MFDLLHVPKRYIPSVLTKTDTKKQRSYLRKSRRMYKRGVYYARPKVVSFKSKKSRHLEHARKMYGLKDTDPIAATPLLARKTQCSRSALSKILSKGRGAYFSSGSRPNQTAESWAIARLASSLTGGNAATVDYSILDKGCSPGSKALRLARKTCRKMGKCGFGKMKRMVGGTLNDDLVLACTTNDLTLVEELIKKRAHVNTPDRHGFYALNVACSMNHPNIVKLLLTHKANINQVDPDGDTSLFVACMLGYLAIVKLLITYRAEINKSGDDGYTPLHVASSCGHSKIVKELIKHHADINILNEDELSPLSMACLYSQVDVVDILLKLPDIDINTGLPSIICTCIDLPYEESLLEGKLTEKDIAKVLDEEWDKRLTIMKKLLEHGATISNEDLPTRMSPKYKELFSEALLKNIRK